MRNIVLNKKLLLLSVIVTLVLSVIFSESYLQAAEGEQKAVFAVE
jgi:hypothetical protein